MSINKKSPRLEPGFLESLPETTISYANREHKAKYDEKNQVLYLLDSDGSVCNWANFDLKKHQEAVAAAAAAATAQSEEPQKIEPDGADEVETAKPPTSGETATKDNELPSDNVTRSPAPFPLEPPADKELFKKKKKKKEMPDEETGWVNEAKEEKPKPRKSKSIAIVSLFCLVVGIGTCVWMGSRFYKSLYPPVPVIDSASTSEAATPIETTISTVPSVETTMQTEPATSPSEPVETEPDNSTYVLKARDTMLPGHVLTSDDFDQEALDPLAYQTLTAGGGFYTKDELERLEGLVVITYVPEGKYLSYEDVSTYYSPANPWGRTESQQMIITLPIEINSKNLSSCLWGNYVDITITIETKLQSANDAENNEFTPPAGIQHQSSTVESILVDTYKLHAAAIVDVLDANKGSLYTRYSALASIPVVFRQEYLLQDYEDLTLLAADTPCYIQIAVPVEQGELLNTLNQNNMTVEIQNPTQNNSTDLQSATYASLQEIGAAIARIMESVYEED